MKHFLIIFLLIISAVAKGQAFTEVSDLPRPNQEWEKGFQERIDQMWGTSRIMKYVIDPNDGNADNGKHHWPRFLAQMAVNKNDTVSFESFIKKTGRAMINGPAVGSFNKPFSCAGYAMYFFHWKDSIAKYDPSQIDLVYSKVNSMWRFLLRTDHLFDACCGYNAGGGKEFNSENYQWMLRTTGYLFAHELHEKTIGGQFQNMNAKNLTGIEIRTGTSSPYIKTINPQGVDVIGYFDGFLKNLTRALYNAGRVEWNSNCYFGHTLNPLHSMYECADKCNDPNAVENKKRAQACLDWMMVEAAIHYRDGFQVAADARAKNKAFLPFEGSVYKYTIPYFADKEHYPSFGTSVWEKINPGGEEIGFLITSAYRPPNIIIDIAQRNYDLPVEIQSAKPFYHIDFGNFFNQDGTTNPEYPYHAWKGEDESKGRRFEFETTYIGNRFTMASAAGGRPDGTIGTYSEQSMWRLGVDGQNYGARMFSGNASKMSTSTGRFIYHQIGQYRNIMMQLVKSPQNNSIWIAVPDSLKQMTTSGASSFWDVQAYRWDAKDLYLDMGNGVYLAIKPSKDVVITIDDTYIDKVESNVHTKLVYSWSADKLGALVIEVAEKENYQNFDLFVAAAKNKSVDIDGAFAQYTGASGYNIKMEYTDATTFMMTPNTFDTPKPNPLNYAGNYPKVWGDGNYIDFMTWDSYRTVFGKPVVTQKWGSGEMILRTNNGFAKIAVDPETAEVSYFIADKNSGYKCPVLNDISIRIFPNPTQQNVFVESDYEIESIWVYGISGNLLHTTGKINNKTAEVNLSSYHPGIFLVKLILSNGNTKTFKVQRV